jgi:hypothetical protein
MIDIGILIANDLEYGAEWRHQKSVESPHDADRNLAAAETLERIAAEFRKLEGSQYHWRVQALFDGYGERFVEVLNSITGPRLHSESNHGREQTHRYS